MFISPTACLTCWRTFHLIAYHWLMACYLYPHPRKCYRGLDEPHWYRAIWGLEVNVSKMKSTVLSKSLFVSDYIRSDSSDIECAVCIICTICDYLQHNFVVQSIVSNRTEKDSKIVDMVLRAIRTTEMCQFICRWKDLTSTHPWCSLFGCVLWQCNMGNIKVV